MALDFEDGSLGQVRPASLGVVASLQAAALESGRRAALTRRALGSTRRRSRGHIARFADAVWTNYAAGGLSSRRRKGEISVSKKEKGRSKTKLVELGGKRRYHHLLH